MKARCFEQAIPGFNIACKVWGDRKNPPILALHGWLDNANSFDKLAPILAERFYLIAIDLPGHGLSSHLPEGCHYHFIDGIFNTLSIIQALGLQHVHLLGHSMGACLASLIAGVSPETVRSLAMIEALGPLAAPEERCCEQLSHFQQQAQSLEKKIDKAYPSRQRTAEARAIRGYLSLENSQILCERGVREDNNTFYWRHDKRLLNASPLRMTEGQILSCLNNIAAPSCLIWGDSGFSFCPDVIRAREAAVRSLTIHHMPGGHHVHMEHQQTVAHCLFQFYDSVPGI